MHNGTAPGLSVVVPTHSGRESVLHTVNAILASDDPSLEVLIVSDGASESTRAIVRTVTDPRVRLLEKIQGGAAAARNHGLRAAQHGWVAFVDDDDVPRPNWTTAWRDAASGGACMVTASVMRHEWGGSQSVRNCCLNPKDPTMSASTLLAGSFWVKKELLTGIGGYDERLRFAENQDLGLRLCPYLKTVVGGTKIVSIEGPLIDIYLGDEASRERKYDSASADSARIFLKRYETRLAFSRTQKASLLRIIARAEGVEGRQRSSIRAAYSAVKAEPTNAANARALLLAAVPQMRAVRALWRSHLPSGRIRPAG